MIQTDYKEFKSNLLLDTCALLDIPVCRHSAGLFLGLPQAPIPQIHIIKFPSAMPLSASLLQKSSIFFIYIVGHFIFSKHFQGRQGFISRGGRGSHYPLFEALTGPLSHDINFPNLHEQCISLRWFKSITLAMYISLFRRACNCHIQQTFPLDFHKMDPCYKGPAEPLGRAPPKGQ